MLEIKRGIEDIKSINKPKAGKGFPDGRILFPKNKKAILAKFIVNNELKIKADFFIFIVVNEY